MSFFHDFSLKFYRVPTTPQRNALGVPRHTFFLGTRVAPVYSPRQTDIQHPTLYLTNNKKHIYVRYSLASAHLDTPNDAASFLSVNGISSKKSMADRVVSPRWAMLFFEVLPCTDTQKNDASSLGVSRPLLSKNFSHVFRMSAQPTCICK